MATMFQELLELSQKATGLERTVSEMKMRLVEGLGKKFGLEGLSYLVKDEEIVIGFDAKLDSPTLHDAIDRMRKLGGEISGDNRGGSNRDVMRNGEYALESNYCYLIRGSVPLEPVSHTRKFLGIPIGKRTTADTARLSCAYYHPLEGADDPTSWESGHVNMRIGLRWIPNPKYQTLIDTVTGIFGYQPAK